MTSKTSAALKDASKAPEPSETIVASWPVLAAKVFVAVVVGSILYMAHAAFIPVGLAFLLFLILSGPVESLHKRGFPRGASAATMLLIALLILGSTVALMWTPAQRWFAEAPKTVAAVKAKIGPVSRFIDRIEAMRKSAGTMGSGAPSPAAAPAAAPQESAPALILDVSGPAIAGLLTFIVVTLFLLAGGPPMLARMTAAFVDNLNSSYVLHIIEKVRGEVGHFYLTTTMINAGLGLATGLAMWAWGMPTPYLWGAMAALLNYIPYAGSATTLVTVSLVAIVSFDKPGHILGVAGSYIALATLEGQVAQPLLVGQRLEVNPLLIFLALWFGGLFWGIAGILLATPVLVALKVIAENSKAGKPMMEFLGPNDQTADDDLAIRTFARRMRSKPR